MELLRLIQRLLAVRYLSCCVGVVLVVAGCTSSQNVGFDSATSTGSTEATQTETDLEAAESRVEELEATVENLDKRNEELTLALEEKEAALRAAGGQEPSDPVGVCPQSNVEPGGDEQVVLVYLMCDQMTTKENRVLAGLFPVRRIVAQDADILVAAMGALLSGSTEVEENAGYNSWFSSATEGALIAAAIEDGVAVIDLDAALIGSLNNVSTSTGGAYFRGQLYGTAFSNAPVDAVQFRLDGDRAGFCGLMGLVLDCTPITRSEWNRDYTQAFGN